MEKTIDITTLAQPPEGSAFRIVGVRAHSDPHPYCIGTRHVAYAADHCGGRLNENAIERAEKDGAHCGVSGCYISYRDHKTTHALHIAITDNHDLNAVPGLHAYLLTIKDAATALGIDGFAFPTEKQIQAERERLPHGTVVGGGMGGFLCPPTHPEHSQSVKFPGGSCALSSVIDSPDEWHPATVAVVRTVLSSWKRPPIDSPEVQDWIRQVLGYFRNCYKGDGPEPECWHADKLRILKKGDDARPNEEHAGVHLIRKYYPEYQINAYDFGCAYWGTKPQAEAATA
jgi:hypothetical protein